MNSPRDQWLAEFQLLTLYHIVLKEMTEKLDPFSTHWQNDGMRKFT